jgi:hypothetical protein
LKKPNKPGTYRGARTLPGWVVPSGPDHVTAVEVTYTISKSGCKKAVFHLPVLPSEGDAERLINQIYHAAREVLEDAGVEEWPANHPLLGRAYQASQTWWNLRCLEHFIARHNLSMAVFFAIHVGASTAGMSIDERAVRVLLSGYRALDGGKKSAKRRRARRAPTRRAAIGYYKRLLRAGEKAEAAKRDCANLYKISRSTLSRWLSEDRAKKSGVMKGS